MSSTTDNPEPDNINMVEQSSQTKSKKLQLVDSIAEKIESYLENNSIQSKNIDKVQLGSMKMEGKAPIVLTWEEDAFKINALQQKLSQQENPKLKYSSPVQIIRDDKEDIKDVDGVLFYIIMKTRNQTEESESDSGVASENSRTGDSPEVSEVEIKNKFYNKTEKETTKASKDLQKQTKINSLKSQKKEPTQRDLIRQKYTIIRRKLQNSKRIDKIDGQKSGVQVTTKPMWFIPGKNSFHVNSNPMFSSHQQKCYSFQCKPRPRKIS